MDIVVVGPGALGCLVASTLLQGNKGTDTITLLDYDSHRANLLDSRGIIYEQGDRVKINRVTASSNPSHIPHADAVFLCVKSYDVRKSMRLCAPLFGDNTLIIFMQNGMAHLAEADNCNRAVPVFGTTTEGADTISPGHIRHAGSGTSYFGFFEKQSKSLHDTLEAIIDRLSAGQMKSYYSTSIYQRLWDKLFVNIGINALTAIHDCRNGKLLEIDEARNEMAAAIAEAETIAQKEQVTITSPLQRAMDVCRATDANISSMLQDVRNKRRTEIDAINGTIVRMAAKYTIDVPVNHSLVSRVNAIEERYKHVGGK